MKILVLLRTVPDLVEELEVDASGRSLDRDALKLTLNEFDDHALEEGLLVKEATGGELVAAALDGEGVDKILYTALAKGADRALKVTGAPTASGARELAALFRGVVEPGGYDLVLTGVQAADERDGQLAPTLAAHLALPSVEVVTGIEPRDGSVVIHKEYSGGVLGEFEVTLPAVLGIQAARQAPRYAPVSRVRQVQDSATVEEIAAPAVDGSTTGIVQMTPAEAGEGAQMLEDLDELVAVLESKGVL